MGHFPIANGTSRCGSVISENDDLPGINSENDELGSSIFSLPNVQVSLLVLSTTFNLTLSQTNVFI